MGLTQLSHKSDNFRPSQDSDYFDVKILVILSTRVSKLTLHFSISQSSENIDESSFKHFVEHWIGMRRFQITSIN